MTRSASLGRLGTGLALLLAVAAPAVAEGPSKQPETALHRHAPLEIKSRPIVSKYSLSLIQPRRVLAQADGTLYVADWAAGMVFRISPGRKVRIVAEDLNEPSSLAMDSERNLFVSTYGQGMTKEGTIVRIAHEDGMRSVVAVGLTAPSAIAFDAQDNLYVASFLDNTISRVGMSGGLITYAANVPAVSAILFDERGDLLALSSTEGAVYRISSDMGAMKRIAGGLSAPSDMLLHPEGHLIVVDFGRGRLVHVDEKGRLKTFAVVPRGTVSAAFDGQANLIVANWDNHNLLKITTNLTVKCPHCGRDILIRLRTPRKKRQPKSGQKPATPVI